MNFAGHGFTVGADLYVNGDGLLTETIPTGEGELLQKIAKALAPNFILVQGAGRTNATPNLDEGNIFLGNASNQPVSAVFTDEANSAILNYTGDITQMGQANVSRIYVAEDDLKLDSGLGTFFDLQMVKQNDQYFTAKQLSRATSTGITEAIVKSRGNVSAPAVISSNDRIHEVDYYGHDGTNYVQTFGEHIYQDSATGGVSTGTIPMGMEIYTQQDGVSGGFDQSIVKFRSNRTIAFNDSGTRGFGTGAGNANIEMDGTINTVANINATGNISGTTFIGDVVGNVTGTVSTLSNFTTDDLTEGASNKYFSDANFNDSILNYYGNILQLNEANINRLSVGQTNSTLDSGFVSFSDFQMVKDNDQYFTTYQSTRNATTGVTDIYVKSRGSLATPATINSNDRIHEVDYYGHDGANYLQTFGTHVYQDAFTGAVTANNIPLGYEIYTKQNGDVSTFDQSLVKFRADRTIAFNDSGTRGFGTGAGNANITMDGTINTVAGINASGTVTGSNFSGSGATLSDINSFGTIDVSGQASVIAGNTSSNLTLQAAGAIVLTTDAANGTVIIGGSGGTYGNTDVENFLSANVITSDIVTQGNLSINQDITADGDVSAANALFADKLYSYTPGGTFTMTALRVTDFKANDPLGIDSTANSSLNSGVYASPFTGAIVYVTGDRNGARGAPAYWSGTEWRYFSDDANVTI
jgi:hypothetical protein